MHVRNVAFAALLCTVFVSGCDKVKQCNKLIDTISAHQPKMEAAATRFGDAAKDSTVIDEFEGVVQGAIDDVKALEFSDEQVAGFAKRYGALLEEAKAMGADLRAASTDPTKLQAANAKSENVIKTENELIKEVNTYCAG